MQPPANFTQGLVVDFFGVEFA